MPQLDHQTIAVTARSRSRYARLKVRQPGTTGSWLSRLTQPATATRRPAPPTAYTPGLAMELLTGTGELPASKKGLLTILSEYRRALHDLAATDPGSQAAPRP